MRKIEIVKIDDREITVKELVVLDIKSLIASTGEKAKGSLISTVDLLFGDVLPAEAISLSCGISVDDLESQFAPSELSQIVEAVKRVNPIFLTMIEKLGRAAEKMQEFQAKI